MGYDVRTEKDIEKMLSKHSKLIVKKIEAIKEYPEEPPGRMFEIYLIEPKLPQDFKGFVQRLVMLIDNMNAKHWAREIMYLPEKNSITFWYD